MLTSLIFSTKIGTKPTAASVSTPALAIGPAIIPKISTAIMGPVDTIATAPKLSSFVDPLLTEQIPITKESKKGAVIVPVATLPASKENPRYSLGANIARIKIIAYKTSKQYLSGTFFSTLNSAKDTNSPAPIPNNERISQVDKKGLKEVICAISTCASGSAIVVTKPKTKPKIKISQIFFMRINLVPARRPTSKILKSIPTRNIACPIASIAPPIKKAITRSDSKGSTPIAISKNTTAIIAMVAIADCPNLLRKLINIF